MTNKNFEKGIIKSIPKKWSEDEEQLLLKLKKEGLANKEIADKLGRTEVSIQIKCKRLKKKNDKYNINHRDKKYETNDKFIEYIKPDSLLEPYAGNCYYKKFKLKKYITNDKDKKFQTDYHLDAFNFLSQFYNQKFDIVDLDPYGSAFECFDLAIKIAKKGIIITFGEYGHKRFKRTDFVSKRYDIKSINEDWIEKFIQYIEKRSKIYNKNITPLIIQKFKNIVRIHFTIEEFKETSQWNNNNNNNNNKEEKKYENTLF